MNHENVEFPEILANIALLKARDGALQGIFFQLLKRKYPEDFDSFFQSYEALVQHQYNSLLRQIPQIDEALRQQLLNDLGI